MSTGRRLFINQLMACCICPLLINPKFIGTGFAGIRQRQSKYSVKATIDHIASYLTGHGATIYARINQEAEIATGGQHFFSMEFLLFGNPAVGGPLIVENPLIALDLPLKVIAWQDQNQVVWLAYNDGTYIENRYSIMHAPQSVLCIDHLVNLALV